MGRVLALRESAQAEIDARQTRTMFDEHGESGVMNSHTSRSFREAFRALPADVRQHRPTSLPIVARKPRAAWSSLQTDR